MGNPRFAAGEVQRRCYWAQRPFAPATTCPPPPTHRPDRGRTPAPTAQTPRGRSGDRPSSPPATSEGRGSGPGQGDRSPVSSGSGENHADGSPREVWSSAAFSATEPIFEPADELPERDAQRTTELAKLNHVQPAFAALALAHERLRAAEPLRKLRLREPCLLAAPPKDLEKDGVVPRVDGLPHARFVKPVSE